MPCSKCKSPRATPKNPAKCFCGGRISDEEVAKPLTGVDKVRASVGAQKVELQSKKVKYSSTFAAHIFDGEPDGTTHKGLHSMVRWRAKDAKTFAVKKGESDADTGAYEAWVRLPGYTASKASTFSPDTWTEAEVLDAIEQAYQAWRIGRGAAKTMIDGKGLTWAGFVSVKGVDLWIGGLGDGDSMAGISTAFPAVNGSFDDPNDKDEPKG